MPPHAASPIWWAQSTQPVLGTRCGSSLRDQAASYFQVGGAREGVWQGVRTFWGKKTWKMALGSSGWRGPGAGSCNNRDAAAPRGAGRLPRAVRDGPRPPVATPKPTVAVPGLRSPSPRPSRRRRAARSRPRAAAPQPGPASPSRHAARRPSPVGRHVVGVKGRGRGRRRAAWGGPRSIFILPLRP